MSTFLFFHAHPDDEAIFTGGTIARLSAEGHRVVVVYATSGELGRGAGPELAERRRIESRTACRTLGAHRLVFLDHHDSGGSPDRRERPWGAFAEVAVHTAAEQLADLAEHERVDALVTYDETGVYGHPDHVHAHVVGREAAVRAGVATLYEVTVDREYLHFVDTHVASIAGASLTPRPTVGLPTVEITTTVDVRPVLRHKLDAIAAHHSQVEGDPTFGSGERFAEVYGYEWFVRSGPATALDDLALVPARRAATVS